MTGCRGLLGMVLSFGCASAEKPPVVVVAAPPVNTTPRASAPPAASTPASSARSTDTSRIDSPLWRSTAQPSSHDGAPPPAAPESSASRREQLLTAADGLMEGDLTLAEQVCAAESEPRQKECIDAFLAQRMGEIGKAMDRSLRGLELLERAGEKRCPGAPDSEQHSECVLAEMERMVTQLAPACANKSGQAQHQCIIDEVFRQLGP